MTEEVKMKGKKRWLTILAAVGALAVDTLARTDVVPTLLLGLGDALRQIAAGGA